MYKLAVLVYHCGLTPAYLADTLQPVAQIRGRQRLLSCLTSALAVPPTRLCTVGEGAFPVAAAKLSNSLPSEVTSSRILQVFKSNLKTHLFSASFLYTVSQKKLGHFYFYNNFGKCGPISIIL